MARVVLIASIVLAAPIAARADTPIENRDYAIDFYDGVALGNTALVGMGGAGAAWLVGTAGVLINPAAIGVRQTTDTDSWNWDYHVDYLNAALSTDYDNNGRQSNDSGQQYITLGIGGRYHDWAIAVTATAQGEKLNDDDTTNQELNAQALRLRTSVAHWFGRRDIAVGLGGQLVSFSVSPTADAIPGDSSDSLFSITGAGLIGGITWVPQGQNFRLGADVETKIFGTDVETSCDPNDCNGYILPNSVRSPARAIIGGAYRFAPTAWNQQVGGVFRDERALLLAADVLVTGSSPNAYGIEAFGQKMLQRSGEHPAVSVRGGAEFEWLPGRLRLRAGSYWEPQRFEGVNGRLHLTFGLEVRVFEFYAWGKRRGRISLTGDTAERYQNIGFSIGFWH